MNFIKSLFKFKKQNQNNSIQDDDISDIFISYSRKDTRKMEDLVNWLKKQGISDNQFFIDQGSIDGALVFTDVLSSAILNCKVLIFFVSRSSINSKWVNKEVFFALNNSKSVLPLMLDNITLPSAMQFQLGAINRLNLYTGNRLENYKAVLKSLKVLGFGIEEKTTVEDEKFISPNPPVKPASKPNHKTTKPEIKLQKKDPTLKKEDISFGPISIKIEDGKNDNLEKVKFGTIKILDSNNSDNKNIVQFDTINITF